MIANGWDALMATRTTLPEASRRASRCRLISLQKDHGLDQLKDMPAGMHAETLGSDFDAGPDAFVDMAAVVKIAT